MPFKETCRMEERIRMLSDYDTGNWSVSDLCRRYDVCRDTFYEWRKRNESGDAANGLRIARMLPCSVGRPRWSDRKR